MRKPVIRLMTAALFMCFISCSKDNATNTSSLAGNWTFMGIHAQTSSTVSDNTGSGILKDVTTSDYTTTDNGGTMSINGTTMAGTGIAYSANMLVFVSEYQDDVLIDTFSSTVPFSLPPTNSTSTFEQIGKDSIHYTGTNMLGSGGSGSPAASGAKFTLTGDILTLTSSVIQDKITDTLGEVITQHETATVVATLKKQ